MATIKETVQQMQVERRARLKAEFEQFQIKQFGKVLEPGDVVQLSPYWSRSDAGDVMVVYMTGECCTTRNHAIGLIQQKYNITGDVDLRDNYCLAYGKMRLKNAKLVGHEDVVVGPDKIGYFEFMR